MFREQGHKEKNRETQSYVKRSYGHKRETPRYVEGELRQNTRKKKARKRKACHQKWLTSLISPRT